MQTNVLLELQSIINGLLGGSRYGVKIRLPHAAVMTILFRKGSASEKLKFVLKAVLEHSRNLACFAAIYKAVLFLLKWLSLKLRHLNDNTEKDALINVVCKIMLFVMDGSSSTVTINNTNQLGPGFPGKTQHAAIAGAIGGYLIWGRYSSINNQIVLYLIPRIIEAVVLLAREKKISPFHWKLFNFDNVYPIKATIVWAIVMALFESNPHVLHPSLEQSMNEIYRYGPKTMTSFAKRT